LVADLKIEVTRTAEPELRGLIARRLQEYNAPFLDDHPFGAADSYPGRIAEDLHAKDAASSEVIPSSGNYAL